MECAAFFSLCVSYLGSWLRIDANSVSWVFVYTGWAALRARHLLWDAYEYQWLWYFLPVLCAVIDALVLPELFESEANADELA